jgi:serine/threonine protein phosphatase PrpC
VSNRQRSEDRAETFECGPDLIIVAADGAGGLRGGAAAADALVAAIRERVGDPGGDARDVDGWLRAFSMADTKLAAEMGGETTGVLVVVGKDDVIGISAGDSEAWIVTATSIDDLTKHQNRARLGSGRAMPVPFCRSSIEGTLVIATDGLFKYASVDAIAAAVRTAPDAESAARRLESLARTPSGAYHDDVAVVIVRLG